MSLIMYAASILSTDCASVFSDAAVLANPRVVEESALLADFAAISCATDNPDAIWMIAYAESGFRFAIVAENGADGKTARVREGSEATKMMRELGAAAKRGERRLNVDVGVMQMNWRVHGEGYGLDHAAIMSPTRQVAYLVDRMIPVLVPACGEKWIACYHSSTDRHQRRYLGLIAKASGRLRDLVTDVVTLRSGDGGRSALALSAKGAAMTEAYAARRSYGPAAPHGGSSTAASGQRGDRSILAMALAEELARGKPSAKPIPRKGRPRVRVYVD